MAHSHGEKKAGYYLEQLCTIGACGALGVVCILMWQLDRLQILDRSFQPPVLIGGIGLLVLVAIRGVSLWIEAGKAKLTHNHHHDHADHDHTDGECSHDECDHDHVHEWTPAKYSVLLLPFVLFVLGLPAQGFSTEAYKKMIGELSIDGSSSKVAAKGGVVLGFRELSDAANFEAARQRLEGQTGKLNGMYMKLGNDREFTLFRVKRYCCAADVRMAQVRIISPSSVTRFNDRDWVEVQGRIEFRKVAGMDKYIPVLFLESPDDVKPTVPESEYDY